MQEIKLNSWEEFEDAVKKRPEINLASPPLFRGERNSSWSLETTLERYGIKDCSVEQYRRAIASAARSIETVLGKSWNLTPEPGYVDDAWKPPFDYPFMAFLRQNGFPSPLLDWSRSPYIAAFFAFQHRNPDNVSHVAIYEFREYGTHGKGGEPTAPTICGLGPWIATDKKHFLQQSEYTICRRGSTSAIQYAAHEAVFANGEDDQDMLVRFLIPSSERRIALSRLKQFNITAYSLFESTTGLMEALAGDLLDH